MPKRNQKTKVKEKAENLAAKLNDVPTQFNAAELQTTNEQTTDQAEDNQEIEIENSAILDKLFDRWDEQEFEPQDFMVAVPIGSLESAVGYSSLLRQLHQTFVRNVAFYKSKSGGSLSSEEARRKAFHICKTKEEARKEFQIMMRLPIENLNFIDLQALHDFAPRVAERFWERTKQEGKKEFLSGHLAANITFPVGYMKGLWNIARYLGVRESFIDDWKPKGGIEIALIDMMTQSYFQWQYWLEQTVKRSQTKEREQHPQYAEWMARRREEYEARGWTDGYWFRPFVSEQQALDQAVQMADRFNRIFLRTLRQLRDLRRYSPVTINNPQQVNIAETGGQQINVSGNEPAAKKVDAVEMPIIETSKDY